MYHVMIQLRKAQIDELLIPTLSTVVNDPIHYLNTRAPTWSVLCVTPHH